VDRVLASEARGRAFDPRRARQATPIQSGHARADGLARIVIEVPVYGRAMHPAAGPWLVRALIALAALALAGCAGTPRTAGKATPRAAAPSADRDGPGANPPPNLEQVPDAEPRVEPLRNGGPNRPYEVFGRTYAPMNGDAAFAEQGLASWYGRKFHGRPTSSGEVYDMYAMTAAHKTMPIPSYARVRNPANGREVIVRVNDRGPFHAGRVIDLSYTAALRLGVLNAVAPVEIERITHDAIRTGSWRRDGIALAAAPAARATPAAEATPPSDTGAAPRAAPGTTLIAAGAPAPAAAPAVAAPGAPAIVEAPQPAARPLASAAPGFWLQLGAFRERDGAFDFQRKVERDLDWLAPLMAVFSDRDLHRLQAGPYASRGDAAGAAERMRVALQLVPMIVERR
jgi:rare lipoprotein A